MHATAVAIDLAKDAFELAFAGAQDWPPRPLVLAGPTPKLNRGLP